jgi:RHS repeat-associated protein
MLTDAINTYGWNAESEIKSAAGVNYTYDGDGNRLQKSNGKIYWYGAGTEILDESDASGNFTNEYVFFGGKRIAMRNVSSGTIYYYAEDFLGSSRTMVQAGQTSVCYDADFYPFGGERDVVSTCSQNYKFEGKERDTETNNDDFGARYYASRLGRWLSADWSSVPAPVPYANLTNPQTLNLYAMVSDNPETFADLNGHVEETSADTKQRGPSGGINPGDGQSEDPDTTTQNDQTAAPQANQPPQTAQNQSQTKQLTADDVSKGIKAFDSDKDDKNPGRVVKALDTMGKDFTVSGDTLKQGVKDSGVTMPKAADKVLANVDSITRTGDKVVITNKGSMTIDLLGQIGKTISFTINESVKGKSGYQGPALQDLKGVGIGIGPFAKHPDHWGPE